VPVRDTQTHRQIDKLGLKQGSFRFAIRPIELLLHYNHFTALFPPGEPVPEENFWPLWDKNITSASAMQGGHNKHYSQLNYSYKTAYWPDLNKSLGHCHSGRFKYDNVGASNAKVPACTTGNLQNKTFSCHHATHYVSWNLVDCCITVRIWKGLSSTFKSTQGQRRWHNSIGHISLPTSGLQ